MIYQEQRTKYGKFMFNLSLKGSRFLMKHMWLYYLLNYTWGIIMTLIENNNMVWLLIRINISTDVLNKMKDVYNRRGTKIFVLDNWLCLNFSANKQEDINAVQLDFLNRIFRH